MFASFVTGLDLDRSSLYFALELPVLHLRIFLHTAGVRASRARRCLRVADGNSLRRLLLAVSTGVPQVQHSRQTAACRTERQRTCSPRRTHCFTVIVTSGVVSEINKSGREGKKLQFSERAICKFPTEKILGRRCAQNFNLILLPNSLTKKDFHFPPMHEFCTSRKQFSDRLRFGVSRADSYGSCAVRRI